MPEQVDWVKWYGNERERYESFTSKLRHLIELILQNKHIESSIEFRTKTLESFSEKVNRDGKAYLDPPSEITDLSGIRIIVRTKGDLERVSQTLQSEFNIDFERSVNKSDLLQSNEFGYLSEHYVISIALNRSKLTEWAPFAGMVAEIQIRTILQHAWASISHNIEYKKSIDIPKELRRRFFRLSALFELADDELDSIVIGSNQLYKEYVEKIQNKVTVVEINVDSLRAYLESSERVQFWAKFIESLGVRINAPGWVSRDVAMAKRAGLETIDDIDDLLDPQTKGAKEYFTEAYRNTFGTPDPQRHSTDINGIITMFLIAKFQNIFTNEVLNREFGWGLPERQTVPAKKYIQSR